MSVNTNPVVGVVVIARHGDRAGFYQSPITYTASFTEITSLGEAQEFQLGSTLKSIYANPASPNFIVGLNGDLLQPTQYTSVADGGGEGGVIFDSALALWQGFYPPTATNVGAPLANGSIITSPLGGFQYAQVDLILPENDVTLEGWTSCNTWSNQTSAFYNSTIFLAKQAANANFLTSLSTLGLIGNRTVALSNMYNIFDFINVQNIHNATYAALLTKAGNSILPMVRDLANWHEYYSFTSPSLSGIGNIGGRALLPEVINSLQSFTYINTTVKIAHLQIAYKPFLSIFNMTNMVAARNPTFPYPEAFVDYASVITLEVRKNMAGTGHDVRFNFRNGSDPGNPIAYAMFGSNSIDYDLATFTSNLSPALLPNTTSWCNACDQPTLRGCTAALALQNSLVTVGPSAGSKVSNVGAGFIGAAVTLALGAIILLMMTVLGRVSFKKNRRDGEGISLGKRIHITGGAESFDSSHR